MKFYFEYIYIFNCPGKSNETYETKELDPIDASNEMASVTILNATTNTGKALQLPITTPKTLSPLVTNCKRNSMALNNLHHPIDAKKPIIKCNCSASSQGKKSSTNEKISSKDGCIINQCLKKESFSCDSISKSSFVTAGPYTDTDQSTNGSRSPKSIATSCSPSGNMMAMPNSTTCGTISPIISLSKSETNISESNNEDNRNDLTIYNVVSLNNLHDTEPFFSRTMNDFSKNQCLTNSSDNDLYSLSPKKHIVTLTNPKVLTTVTVSMRNAADVSDKVF